MVLLLLGLLLWTAAHLFKRVAPEKRGSMGSTGQGVVALAILASIALMIFGYRGWEGATQIWYPAPFLTHVNNLLMMVAVYLFFSSGAKNWITTKVRHPQLTGFKIWATAHLVVNGDIAAIVLFGGLLAWAVLEVIVINKAEGPWAPSNEVSVKREVVAIAGSLVAFLVITLIHNWLGYYPFG